MVRFRRMEWKWEKQMRDGEGGKGQKRVKQYGEQF